MWRPDRSCLALATLVAVIAAGSVPASQTPQATVRRYALLVGVTDFVAPEMARHNLRGPANDVALLRTLLTGEGFRVPAANIVSLGGLPRDESARPTRANIEREFRRLQSLAGPGDQVLVFLAGHGTQQPADVDPADEEPDGLDEVFLPADASGWDQSANRITNAIVDDDIRRWIGAIRTTGAIVTIIVDACHSGTITRGSGPQWRERGIPVEAIVPASALAATSRTTSASPTRSGQSRAFELAPGTGEIAALYAADVLEATPELPMPDRNGPVHGLFTYTVTRVLSEHAGTLTYRELVQRVIDRYRAEGFAPTPAFEGTGVDRAVLGERTARVRTAFALDARDADRWTVSAGSIHGLTGGSILEVLSPAAARTPIGYVRIDDVRPTTALVTPIAFAGMRAPDAARAGSGSVARVRYHEFGPLRLRVALRGSVPAAVDRALTALASRSYGLAVRVDSEDADWFIQTADNRVILIPASPHGIGAARGGDAQTVPRRFDVADISDVELPSLLADRVRAIARAANLTRLSSYVDAEAGLAVEVLRIQKGAATATSLLSAAGAPIAKAGDSLQFVIRNTGTIPLDVTVLYVDAHFGIQSVFPEADRELDNRLDPGRARTLDAGTVTSDPLGWESVIAIGVESTPRHENFRMLAQDSLDEVRSSGARSPLRALLESAVSGTRAARASAEDDLGRFAIAQTWLRVEE